MHRDQHQLLVGASGLGEDSVIVARTLTLPKTYLGGKAQPGLVLTNVSWNVYIFEVERPNVNWRNRLRQASSVRHVLLRGCVDVGGHDLPTPV
jgi:hypothetical protein